MGSGNNAFGSEFFEWGKQAFPNYTGEPSNLQHDSIDDFNREMQNRMWNNKNIAIGTSTQLILENTETDIEKLFRLQFPEEYEIYKASMLLQSKKRHQQFTTNN